MHFIFAITFQKVLWHTGCRLGGIIALDLEDYDREANFLEFRHRSRGRR